MQFSFGSGIMYAIRTDLAGQTPIRFGAMQDVSIEFDGELKELYAQNQFAIDAARGKVKIKGKSKLAQISALAFNTLFFGGTLTSGQVISAYNEQHTTSSSLTTGATSAATVSGSVITFSAVPAGVAVGQLVSDNTTTGVIPDGTLVLSKTSTTVTLSHAVTGGGVLSGDTINFYSPVVSANSADYMADLGTYFSNSGTLIKYTIGAPSAGEYTEVGGSYFFGDLNVSVLLNYLYTVVTGNTLSVGNPFMGTTPRFMGVFSNTYEGQSVVMQLFACVATKLTMPTKIDDYTIPELDFSAYQNAAGQTVDLFIST